VKNKWFSNELLLWYDENKRELPWRLTKNPYQIWLSEIILQQTRIQQGLPYFYRFLDAFPDLAKLAMADEKDVLRLWQGLGYYSRARNLHRCARLLIDQHGGEFPSNYSSLLNLPGVGPYTAAALASISFGQSVPVVDGNVYRLLARFFGKTIDIANGRAFKEFFSLAQSLMDVRRPGVFNQAMMEAGAMICLPRNPLCEECPLAGRCFAYSMHRQHELPVKTVKAPPKERYFYYFLLEHNGRFALHQRKEKDIWKGLYEPYLVETDQQSNWEMISDPLLDSLHKDSVEIVEVEESLVHMLSHRKLITQFIHLNLSDRWDINGLLDKYNLTLHDSAEADRLPKPVLVANYLNRRGI